MPHAGPTRFTSPLAVQSDLLSCHEYYRGFRVSSRQIGPGPHAATGSCLKSSPYFKTAQAIRAFLAAMAIAARQ